MKIRKMLLFVTLGCLFGLHFNAMALPGRAVIAAKRGDVTYAGFGDSGKVEEGMALMSGYSESRGIPTMAYVP